MEFVLKKMNSGHISQIAKLEKVCFSVPWSENCFYEELKNDLACYLVAEKDGQVLGYGGLWRISGEGHITNIAVHPGFRRLGIGSCILDEFLKYAKKERLFLLTLEVRKTNISAKDLYKKFGFKTAGIRKGYYQDNGEDAVIMTLLLKNELEMGIKNE